MNQIKPRPYEILGIGAPYLDLLMRVEESFLSERGWRKGGSSIISIDEMQRAVADAGGNPIRIAGGSGANTIKGLAQLGHSCALLGKIGRDDAAKHFLKTIKSYGIESLYLPTDTPTSQILCLITPDGDRTMRAFIGAGHEMMSKDLSADAFTGVKLVHIEGYSLIRGTLTRRAMELAKEAGALISFDLASFEVLEAHREVVLDLLHRYVDIAFANAEETKTLTGLDPERGCEALRELCNVAVVLMGPEGCWVGKKKELIRCAAFPRTPLDTTGAGDLFSSGFLHGYLHNYPLDECARLGALMGGAVVEHFGAEIPHHIWPNIHTLIKQTPN